MAMDMVFAKTRELGQALLETEQYKKMKEAEDRAMKNSDAAQLMTDLLEKRGELHAAMGEDTPDPGKLKRLSEEMDDIQEKLQLMDDIVAMTQARSEFNALIGNINQVLQFIVTGRMDSGDCAGDCSSCGGCH